MISFDVKAWMEEKERRTGWVKVNFSLNVGTKPNVVKFEVEGTATLDGRDEEIRTILEPDPETQIPLVFKRVYQHVFMSMYLLATLMDAPYPPANLLYSKQEQIASLQMRDRPQTTPEPTQQESPTTASAPEAGSTMQPTVTNAAPSEQRADSELRESFEPDARPQTREVQSTTETSTEV